MLPDESFELNIQSYANYNEYLILCSFQTRVRVDLGVEFDFNENKFSFRYLEFDFVTTLKFPLLVRNSRLIQPSEVLQKKAFTKANRMFSFLQWKFYYILLRAAETNIRSS